MTQAPNPTWQRAARFAAIVFAFGAAWFAFDFARDFARTALKIRNWSELPGMLFFLIFTLPFVAAFAWVAFRLWSRWSASTARLSVAVGLAIALLWLCGLPAGTGDMRERRALIAEPAALIIGAFLYRLISRRLIRAARLDDPLDPSGHPIGHAARVRSFAQLLGLSIWISGQHLLKDRPANQHSDVALHLSILIPILLGWGAYKLVLWQMLPPPPPVPPALAPGPGFEVILPPEQQIPSPAPADQPLADSQQQITNNE